MVLKAYLGPSVNSLIVDNDFNSNKMLLQKIGD